MAISEAEPHSSITSVELSKILEYTNDQGNSNSMNIVYNAILIFRNAYAKYRQREYAAGVALCPSEQLLIRHHLLRVDNRKLKLGSVMINV